MDKVKISNVPYGPYITVIVGADMHGKPNYTTVGAYGVVSQNPVLYVSLKNTHYSTKGISETGSFSVNIPGDDLLAKTDACGMISGKQRSKSSLFTPFYDPAGVAPMISECPFNYLCKVIQTIPVFDFTLFLGEIQAVYAASSCLSDGKPDAAKAHPILMMNTGYYGIKEKIGSVFNAGKPIVSKQ
ncbi:MAG: flavin reductase family protein [Ethanoligenens sp.]